MDNAPRTQHIVSSSKVFMVDMKSIWFGRHMWKINTKKILGH